MRRSAEIEEVGKPANKILQLGNTLQIGDEAYESLDEVMARFVNPISDMCQELIRHSKYFTPPEGEADMNVVNIVKRHLLEQKKADARQRPYVIFYECVAGQTFFSKVFFS